ncbi:MAG: methyltransferase domain-containing protein [Magnetococcales bacterium]|nr:methyltransferase domain-containing protein [Magnetococcales bacterium]
MTSLFQQGRLAELEAAARERIARFPEDSLTWSALGIALHGQGRHAEAIRVFQEALGFWPDDAELLTNAGAVLLDLGQLDEGEALLRRALAIRPDFVNAYVNLTQLLQGRDRVVEDAVTRRTEDALRSALHRQPTISEHYHKLMIFIRIINKNKKFFFDPGLEIKKITNNKKPSACPICAGSCHPHDRVDFNRTCQEVFREPSGIIIDYYLCDRCGFCFAHPLTSWDHVAFKEYLYNENYEYIDNDYKEARPLYMAHLLLEYVGDSSQKIKHLDYGGGNGALTTLLQGAHWQSVSYDPYMDHQEKPVGKFDLITAFEVFEHVPKIHDVIIDIKKMLTPQGIILFTTALSDGYIMANQPLTWWYAAPRNGHISLYAAKTLSTLARQHGFRVAGSDGRYIFFSTLPEWWKHHPHFQEEIP